MTWSTVQNENGTLFYYCPEKQYHSKKILAIDLDWTLIQPEIGKKFPISEDDWGFRFSNKILKEYYDKGYKIVILSNQKSTFDGKHAMNFDGFKRRWKKISDALGFPVYLLASPKDDFYRKPCPGMWDYLISDLNNGIIVDKSQCLFVGDAAGRPRIGKTPGDFSDSDLKMALNAGIEFKTPEQFFSNDDTYDKKLAISSMKTFQSCSLIDNIKDIKDIHESNLSSWDKLDKLFSGIPLESGRNLARVLMMCGSPSSGKSSIADKILNLANQKSSDWEILSLDVLKNKIKMKAAIAKILREKTTGGIIIDCTNGSLLSREEWFQVAQQYKTPIWCIHMLTSKSLAFHLNNLRKARRGVNENYYSKNVPNVAIHRYFKNYEPPGIDEGFQEIIEFEFEPHFKNDREKKEFKLLF